MNHWICWILKFLLPALLKTKGNKCLSILIYHRVLPKYDYMRPDEPTVDQFDWQMELISRYMTPLSLHDALIMLEGNRLPDNAVCVTFDDGYADNAIYALPILKKWGIPATVFVSTGFLDGGIMWNDSVLEAIRLCENEIDLTFLGLGICKLPTKLSRKDIAHEILKKIKHKDQDSRNKAVSKLVEQVNIPLPRDLMMSSQQVLEMHEAGIDIGGHTVNHPILTKLKNEDAEAEIINGKNYLEVLLGKPIEFFAYPNGQPVQDFNSKHKVMAKKCGFKAALSTAWGVSTRETDKYELARFTPWDKTPEKFLLRLLLNQRKN